MKRFGVTERGDAGLDLSWTQKLPAYDAVILITKSLNDKFIEEVVKAHNASFKIMVHITTTGYGGTILEPCVKDADWTLQQTKKLIKKGFPADRLVLRIDPIIPTDKGIFRATKVLELFEDVGIKRVRYSFMDMYPHVKERFKAVGVKEPYNSFNPPQNMIDTAIKVLSSYERIFDLESCAENTPHKKGCISELDYEILQLDLKDVSSKSNQRKTCLCFGSKKEILENRKRCSHNCLYCYWKD